MDVRRGQFGKHTRKYQQLMKLNTFRRTASYKGMDKEWNVDFYQELNAVPLLDYLENYKHNWTKHLHHMNR